MKRVKRLQLITLPSIEQASGRLTVVMQPSPLQRAARLSERYGADVWLKREDLNEIRSFKIRGAYNKMVQLKKEERKRGVVCASAGNHAQGVALSCTKLGINGTIFMPVGTPLQKIDRVRKFGNNHVTIKLEGDTYDDAQKYAHAFEKEQGASYIHAFDDALTIAGQGTVGKELLEQYKDAQSPNIRKTPMVIVVPVGGGGLIAGIAAYAKLNNPAIEIIGAEPEGAASMYEAFKKKRPVALEKIDTFVDGTAVKRVGNLSFKLAKQYVSRIIKVPEGKIAKTMVELYQNEGIVTEPAGALSIAALSSLRKHIKGKTVVCIVSGGNNDILRYAEILERSLIYQGRKHYFIIQFAQKPGQLRSFLNRALGPTDDIVRFEYIKKTNTENGPALVGIEQQKREHYTSLVKRMDAIGLTYQVLSPNDLLYQYIV